MKVVVTGATGYLGAEIVAELLSMDSILVTGWGRDSAKLESLAARFGSYGSRLDLQVHDLDKEAPLRDRVDVVVHAAALRPDDTAHTPVQFQSVNVLGTARVLRQAQQAGCSRFLYISSQSVYGTHGAPWSETSPALPETPYARSKRDGELQVLSANILSCGILRLSRLYGATPFMRWTEFPGGFAHAVSCGRPLILHGSGDQRIDLLHVRDAARAVAMIAAMENPPASCVYNVGSGGSLTLNELADVFVRLASRFGFPPVHVEYDRNRTATGGAHFELAIDSIRETIGWRPAISLEEGIGEYLEAARSGGCGDRVAPA